MRSYSVCVTHAASCNLLGSPRLRRKPPASILRRGVLCLAALLALAGACCGQEEVVCRSSTVLNTAASSGSIRVDGSAFSTQAGNCTIVLGSAGSATSLSNISVSTDAGLVLIYGTRSPRRALSLRHVVDYPSGSTQPACQTTAFDCSLAHSSARTLVLRRWSLPSAHWEQFQRFQFLHLPRTPHASTLPRTLTHLSPRRRNPAQIADAPWADPARLVLTLTGRLPDLPPPLSLLGLPELLQSTTGFFTVSWRIKYNAYVAPVGFRADFATRAAGAGLSPASIAPTTTQQQWGAAAVSAATLTDIQSALADPSVGTIRLTAQSVALSGSHLLLSGPGRAVTLTGACAAPPCTLDARALSRHFRVSRGATLRLQRLRLVGGAARLGGSALVEAGSAFVATDCEFAHSTSVGAGGCVCGAAATLDFQSSAHIPASRPCCLFAHSSRIAAPQTTPPSRRAKKPFLTAPASPFHRPQRRSSTAQRSTATEAPRPRFSARRSPRPRRIFPTRTQTAAAEARGGRADTERIVRRTQRAHSR